MKTPVDSRLADEAARFQLRFRCDDCVHFAEPRGGRCAHGYPTAIHRREIAGSSEIVFCKEFELA